MKNIFRNYDKLNSNDIRILQYIVKNIEKVQKMTARKLSEELYISKTTLINLSKKLGYEGYSELKYALKDIKNNEGFQTGTATSTHKDDIFEELSHEVNRTLMIQDSIEVEEVTRKILDSKVVYVVSRGSSMYAGEYLSSRLAIYKIKSIFISDINLLNTVIEHMTSEEIIIFLSQSGQTKIIVEAASRANMAGLKTVAITSFGKNELQKYCNNALYFYANDVDTRNNDSVSRVGMNIVIQLLIEYIKRGVRINE